MPLDTTRVPEVRTSEMSLFKRCPWAWHQAYRQGLRPKRTKDALWFGELYHIALAGWYCGPGPKRGPHPAETFEKLAGEDLRYAKIQDASEEEAAKWADMRVLGVTMLESYVSLYGRDDNWSVISPERTFAMRIQFPDWWGEETRAYLARYVGTYDLVYRDLATGWIWLGEHKTAKSIRVDHLPLDPQAGAYTSTARATLLKMGLISERDRFHGIMYNFSRKALPDPRPVDAAGYVVNKPVKAHFVAALEKAGCHSINGKPLEKIGLVDLEAEADRRRLVVRGERSKVQPTPLFRRYPLPKTRAEQRSQLIRIQSDLTVLEATRRGELPLTKTPHWSCANLCDFYDMCRLHEAGGNWKDLRDAAYDVQDPYAAHRKSTDEMGTFEL